MMSYTKSAIDIAEKYVTHCSEFSILNTREEFNENFIKRHASEYDVIVRVYAGELDKLTEVIRLDLFEHFQKRVPEKLKNQYVPAQRVVDKVGEMTIYIGGRSVGITSI